MPSVADPSSLMSNRLVAALPDAVRQRLLTACDRRDVTAGTIIFEAGDDVTRAFLPEGPTLVSYIVELGGGASVETALVGSEGAVGGIVSGGFLPAFSRTVVQYPGPIASLPLERLEALKREFPEIDALFARYADCLLAQIFQATACAAVHSVAERTARWLVQAHDRTGETSIPITQQRLADILGVGRSYAARVIAGLVNDGVLSSHRGQLKILKVEALRGAACNCDDVVKRHFVAVVGIFGGY